ncbi:alpha/beta-hydrolase [Xylaria bambusicola]|uniref:alpha/beta-hydrolase n=1 Tax=Xylaria bambusicola TaxID=326684 RepID=UPI002008097B|nr:alpha/beta-hydrolase [Xylaria bambusicola]KAI0521169.1 alpha/beta-hydrolase [Xylaria bambusicola]
MFGPTCLHRVAEAESGLRIAYIESTPKWKPEYLKGVILLIHGFPQTSYQFRHVINPLAARGYRVLAPDYRGAGKSSKPQTGFTKSTMARDLVLLLDTLNIKEKVHVIGHDIGGMIAYTLAARYPAQVASLNWGECPLPGTTAYEEDRTTNAVQQFHFIFHCVPDLAVALVTGRERIYLSHFFEKLAYNVAAITDDDLDHYVRAYEQPGALRCAFEMYKAFEQDAQEHREWISENGKLNIPTLCLSGDKSRHREAAQSMCDEVLHAGAYEIALVADAAHWVAEENPESFIRESLGFIERVEEASLSH